MRQVSINLKFFNCLVALLILLVIEIKPTKAQDATSKYSDASLIVGTGIGFSSGFRESGLGMNFLLGWQKSVGNKKRIEINPYLSFGTYKAFAIPTDTPRQLFKSTNFGVDSHFHFSFLTLSAGIFTNYTRGMFHDDGYFYDSYFGLKGSIGFKLKSKWDQLSYEFKPFNVLVGTNGFLQGYAMYTMKIKLKKK